MSQPLGYQNIASGQVTMTGAAVQLPSNPASKIVVAGLKANTGPIYVGPVGVTVATGLEVPAGSAIPLEVANSNMLYAIGTAGDKLSFAAIY